MDDGPTAFDAEALADVAYLSRSANRVAILTALANAPSSRRRLGEETDVARTTLDRIVNEMEERGWAERTPDGEYVATPAGERLMAEFAPFLDAVEAIRGLGDAVAWLPLSEFPIGLEHFSDAVVRRPATADPVEAVEYMAVLVREAATFRFMSHLAPPEQLDRTLHERVVDGDLEPDGVVTDDLLAFLDEHPRRRERWREQLDNGSVLHSHEGPLPCNLWIIDDTVLLKQSGPGPIDESYGAPIVSTDDAVRAWAGEIIDTYRDAGTLVQPDDPAMDSAAAPDSTEE